MQLGSRSADENYEEVPKRMAKKPIEYVDTHGFLVYYEKMDDTQTASTLIAVEKARTSAMTRRPTKVFTDTIAKGGGGVAIMGLPGVTPNTGRVRHGVRARREARLRIARQALG